MRFEIGSTYADIQVLLATLRGTHRSTRTSIITAVIVALAVCATVPEMFKLALAAQELADQIFGYAMAVFFGAFAVGIVLHVFSTYSVDESGIEKKHAVRWFSWRVERADIHLVTLVLEKGWSLELTTTASRKRSLELDGSLREALAKLYPEVAPFRPTATDIRRWKWIAAVIVTVAAIAGGVIWWLTLEGVLYWP